MTGEITLRATCCRSEALKEESPGGAPLRGVTKNLFAGPKSVATWTKSRRNSLRRSASSLSDNSVQVFREALKGKSDAPLRVGAPGPFVCRKRQQHEISRNGARATR